VKEGEGLLGPFSQFLPKKDLQPSFLSHSIFSVSHCSEKNVGECREKGPFFRFLHRSDLRPSLLNKEMLKRDRW
jgi:hypothetical protein